MSAVFEDFKKKFKDFFNQYGAYIDEVTPLPKDKRVIEDIADRMSELSAGIALVHVNADEMKFSDLKYFTGIEKSLKTVLLKMKQAGFDTINVSQGSRSINAFENSRVQQADGGSKRQYKQFNVEFRDAKEHFEPYLAPNSEFPADEEFAKDADAAIQSLLETAQKLNDDGNITPDMAQDIVNGLTFIEKLAHGIGDNESAQNISFLAVELGDFIRASQNNNEKPYLRGLEF